MLDLIGVRKVFNAGTINEKVALDGIDFHLSEGDFVTVIGGNGAGKSTMLNAIAGVWPVDGGKILIDGQDVTGIPEYKRAALIGRVTADHGGLVGMKTTLGGTRIVDMPIGEILPRIC